MDGYNKVLFQKYTDEAYSKLVSGSLAIPSSKDVFLATLELLEARCMDLAYDFSEFNYVSTHNILNSDRSIHFHDGELHNSSQKSIFGIPGVL